MKIIDLEKLLPADVPPGERILWHGRPNALGLARRAFRGDLVAAWFVAMAVWNGVVGLMDAGWLSAAMDVARTLATGAASLVLIGLLGWLSARTTLYVVSSRRIVLKAGIALPVFFNVPFAEIVAADVQVHPDSTADIAFRLTPGQRIAYLHLWPHAKPFCFKEPQPMLRSVLNGAVVAERLRVALEMSPISSIVSSTAAGNDRVAA